MRFSAAVCSAVVLSATTTTATAFVPCVSRPNRRVRVQPVGVSGLGWDNDKFLSSLSGNDKDREEANDRYYRMSRFGRPMDDNDDDIVSRKDDLSESIPGAKFSKEIVEKIKKSHTPEEEASGGGKMFREMMARAQQPRSYDSYDYRPPQPPPPQQQQQQQPPSPTMDPNKLSVEDQARMFREMMMQQQNSAAAYPVAPQAYPEPPPPPGKFMRGGVDGQGRKIGRNRDADAINNSADVYFAQLKRDSTVRNIARLQGDTERSEAVFADPAIWEIKTQLNPYLEEQKEKERALLTTSPEEMITPEMFIEREKKPASYSGVSYKEKLRQAKQQKSGQATAPPEEKKQTAASSAVTEPPKPAPAPPAAVPSTKPATKPETTETWAQKLSIEEEQTVIPQPAAVKPPAPAPLTVATPKQLANPKPVATPAPVAKEPRTEDTTRRDVRTLMGLLLKHRGGSGFGMGRLRGQEPGKFESMAGELVAILKEEALRFPQESFDKAQDLKLGEAAAVPEKPPSTPAAQPHRSSPQPAAAAPAASYAPVPQQQQQQAAASYAPVPQQQQQQQRRGGAMEQAIRTPSGDRINSVLSCIDGAIQMYRNAPPELEEAVLITLRAALLSAVNSCNAIIAENEVKNLEAYRTATTDPRTRTRVQAAVASAFKSTTEAIYDVVPEQELAPPEPAAEEPATLGTKDENAQFYEHVLAKLRAASGTGKMGLRDDLSPREAAELADAVDKMRSMLVQELDQGISP